MHPVCPMFSINDKPHERDPRKIVNTDETTREDLPHDAASGNERSISDNCHMRVHRKRGNKKIDAPVVPECM